MSEARIGIYLRLRPPRKSAGRVVVDTEGNWVEFNVPKDAAQGLINNSKENYKFQFDGVFPPDAQQGTVFETIARPAICAALEGINGTVFAYGQTGSGKTFTVTGGTERYADRGLIPRALAALFEEIGQRPTHSYSVTISYLELYNEEGFDLLDPTREVKRLEDLPKVFVMEDDDSRMHIRNLSTHHTTNEEEALNLLFLGDTNRMVAETPLNQASSRSHTIFTVQIEARKAGDDRVRRSKLHFVDLAGSERVTKTGIEGAILKEAKFINLSLHFLEQVIIALQEGRPHIPYRNSLLTQMLRDSLGGNCRTVMIANVAPETQHIEESISTCRFAQRVAMISNQVTVNEELDLNLVIKRLKQENQALRQELQLLKGLGDGSGGGGSGSSGGEGDEGDEGQQGEGSSGGDALAAPERQLGEQAQERLRQQVRAFVGDSSPDALLDIEPSMMAIRAAFSVFKSMLKEAQAAISPGARSAAALKRLQGLAGSDPAAAAAAGEGAAGALQQQQGAVGEAAAEVDLVAEVEGLRSELRKREREIALLAGMLRKQGMDPVAAPAAANEGPGGDPELTVKAGLGLAAKRPSQQQQSTVAAGSGVVALDEALLADKNRAFEYFCSNSPTHDTIQEHKVLLKSKYEEAKGLGAQVHASKQRIGELRSLIEQRRVQRSMAALMQGQPLPEGEDDPEEERAKQLVEKEKGMYRELFGSLKGLKSEIDRLQSLLDRSRAKLQLEFQDWYSIMLGLLSHEVQARVSQAQQQQQQAQQAQQQQQQAQQQQQEGGGGGWRIPAVPAGGGQAVGTEAGGEGLPAQGWGSMQAAATGRPAAQQQEQEQQQQQQQEQQEQQQQYRLPSRQLSRQSNRLSIVQARSSGGAAPALTDGGQQSAFAGDRRGSSEPHTPREAAQQGVGGMAQCAVPAPALASIRPPSAAPAAAAAQGTASYSEVDPEVLRAALPLLTGNPTADADIIHFYQARAALLKSHLYR